MESFHERLSSLRKNSSAFRISFLIDLILCQIGYISVPAIVCAVILFIWGCSLFLENYVKSLKVRNVDYYGWLLLFILSNIITLFIRGYSDGIWQSAVMILFMPTIFFMFYGLHTEARSDKGKKKIERELYLFCNIMLWLSLVLNVVSLFTLYTIGKSVTYIFGYLVVYENRFTGVYYNPNLMAFTSFCAAFCCHLLWQNGFVKRVTGKSISLPKKIIVLVSAAVNIWVIFLTDSNATMLIIVCYMMTYICYRFFGGRDVHFGYIFKRAAALLVAVFLVTFTFFGARYIFQTSTTYTMNSSENSTNVFEDEDDELNKITFEHQNKNLDSGRIKLFKQGVNVIRHHPFFGVGKGNIIMYGNRYNNNKMKYDDFHNGYLTILVCSGFLGFFFFIGFAVCLGKRMVSILFSVKPSIRSDVFPCMASFTAAYCIYAFFEKAMIYDYTFMVTVFWFVLGFATAYMADYEGDDYKFYAFSSMSLFKGRGRKNLPNKPNRK